MMQDGEGEDDRDKGSGMPSGWISAPTLYDFASTLVR